MHQQFGLFRNNPKWCKRQTPDTKVLLRTLLLISSELVAGIRNPDACAYVGMKTNDDPKNFGSSGPTLVLLLPADIDAWGNLS
ncbi:MAG: hypothetical protein K1Y36_03450 [Blastocatellia bacterium]|nr:hypothetical protein [Blastocatellia bacterium]